MRADKEAGLKAAHHGATIEALARETGAEPEKVQALYEREFAGLEATATVRGFLSVLACRNVRAVLRRKPHH